MDKGKFHLWCLPLLLSCVLHAPVLCLFVDQRPETASERRGEIRARLVSEREPQGQGRETMAPKPGQSVKAGASEASSGTAATSEERAVLSTVQRPRNTLDRPIDDSRLQKILKQIKKKIIAHWERATPPALGLVSLEIEIRNTGRLSSRWITDLRGPSELGDFIVDLVDGIAFTDLTELKDLNRPLRIECSFDVTGRSPVRGAPAQANAQ
mgnify:CR=1 FL=1